MLEEICGVPVLGVVPMAPHIHIDEEDSVALARKDRHARRDKVNVAVVATEPYLQFYRFQYA